MRIILDALVRMARLSTRLLTGSLTISILLTDGKAAVVSTFVCKPLFGYHFHLFGDAPSSGAGSRGGSVFNSRRTGSSSLPFHVCFWRPPAPPYAALRLMSGGHLREVSGSESLVKTEYHG